MDSNTEVEDRVYEDIFFKFFLDFLKYIFVLFFTVTQQLYNVFEPEPEWRRRPSTVYWNTSPSVASPREGMGGSGPPTSVQTTPEVCTNPLRSVLYIGGGPMHVYCNFLLLTSKEKLFGPPTFFGLATPLPPLSLSCHVKLYKYGVVY